MEEHPLELQVPHLFIELGIAIFWIARHRMTGIGRVHADLVGVCACVRACARVRVCACVRV